MGLQVASQLEMRTRQTNAVPFLFFFFLGSLPIVMSFLFLVLPFVVAFVVSFVVVISLLLLLLLCLLNAIYTLCF